jgi:hypothetical protein
MKVLLQYLLLLTAGSASAQATQPAAPATPQPAPLTVPAPPGAQPAMPSTPRTFEEIRQARLAEIKKRIADLQELASCVQAATGPEQMRACRFAREPVRRRP